MAQTPFSIIEDVPPELWSEIAHHMKPRTILSLSHVCRALHDQFSRREVWECIFRSMCRERAIFIPSYGNIDEMTLFELIRAAFGPHRWGQLLTAHHSTNKQQGREMNSGRTPLTPLLDIIVPIRQRRFGSQFLVPGGRFLVAFGSNSLYLYDLGEVGRKLLETPLIVAQESVEEYSTATTERTALEVIGEDSDESRLRVGLSFSGGAAQADRVVIYDIVLNNPEARFTKLCSLSFSPAEGQDSTLHTFHVRRNYVYLRYTRTGVICDFIQGRYCDASFHSPDLKEGDAPLAALFSGSTFAHVHRHSVMVWKVPAPDKPIGERGVVVIPESDFIRPDFILPLPSVPLHDPHVPAVVDVVLPSPWLQNQLKHMYFDFIAILSSLDDSQLVSSRYRLDLGDQEDDIHLDLQFNHTLPDHYLFFTSPRIKHFTEYAPGTLMPLTTKEHSIDFAYIEPLSGPPGENGPSYPSQSRTTVIQAEDHEIPRLVRDTLLCGVSGRAWYTLATSEGPATRVVDYHSFRRSSLAE